MDRNGNPSLTRPATPQAFRMGRYSFVPQAAPEEITLPTRLREDKVTVREMPAARR
jgi:hypothetical protein